MNSSISNFKAHLANVGRAMGRVLGAFGTWLVNSVSWLAFPITAMMVAAAVLVSVVGLAVIVEPYDTGRVRLFEAPGVRPQGPRITNASRGRDQAYNAAIFGNSHMQLLEPEALSKASGLQILSLTVPATGPKEQLVLIEWFLRQHGKLSRNPAKALVIGMDNLWCQADPALPNEKPFPFWLYDANPANYLRGLLRYDLLEEVPRRIGYILSRNPERARADGWWDYEPNYLGLGYVNNPAKRDALQRRINTTTLNATGRYPALQQLEAALNAAPDLLVLAVRPPVFVTGLPLPGSPEATSDTACGDAIAAFAARRAQTAFVDWRGERRETMQADFWFDHTHYRKTVARRIEADIVTAVDLLR